MAYEISLTKTMSDKVLLEKSLESAGNPQYDGYQHGFASVVYKFFDEKPRDTTTHTGAGIEISEDQPLADELHNPIISKNQKRKMNSFLLR